MATSRDLTWKNNGPKRIL